MKYNFFLFLWLFVSDSFLSVFTKASFCFGIIFNTSTLKAKSSLLLKLCCSFKFRRFFIKGEKLSISLTSKLKFSRYQKIIRTPFDKNKNSNNYSIFFLSNWRLSFHKNMKTTSKYHLTFHYHIAKGHRYIIVN